MAQMVKDLPAMQEAWVRFLGLEDPQEKGMATHSSTLAWRIPWTEKPGGLQPWGRKESDTIEWLTLCWHQSKVKLWGTCLAFFDFSFLICTIQKTMRGLEGV